MNFNGYQGTEIDKPAGLVYKLWKDQLKGGYFTLSNDISDYFPFLRNSDADILYLFYAIKADNDFGTSTYGIDTLSEKLNVTRKTINNWNNILIDAGLISRYKSSKYKSSVTELLPLKDAIIRPHKDNVARTLYHLKKLNGYTLNSVVYLNLKCKGKAIIHKYIIASKRCFKHQVNRSQTNNTSFTLDRYIVVDDPNYQPTPETTIENNEQLKWLKGDTGELVWKKTIKVTVKGAELPSISLLIKTDKQNETKNTKILETLKQFDTDRKIRKFEKENAYAQVN